MQEQANLEIEVKVDQVEIDQMQEKWITCLVSMHFYDRSIHKEQN